MRNRVYFLDWAALVELFEGPKKAQDVALVPLPLAG
jgi:hypothetical protein